MSRETLVADHEVTLVGEEQTDLGVVFASKYRITGKLGEGGMGMVYEARHLLLGTPVALKVVHPARYRDRAAERMMREARATAATGHPNIAAVLDVGWEGDPGQRRRRPCRRRRAE